MISNLENVKVSTIIHLSIILHLKCHRRIVVWVELRWFISFNTKVSGNKILHVFVRKITFQKINQVIFFNW